MSKKHKILVCGDVEGNFKTLFSRVNTINEKSGPFDFLLCVGNFFSNQDSLRKLEPYKNGTLSVSVPTYILGPNSPDQVSCYGDPDNYEICPNVSYLGKHGILSSGGINIAYVSGIEGKKGSDITFSEKEAITVRDAAIKKCKGSQFMGVDVLITSEWPKDVTSLDKNVKSDEIKNEGSSVLSWLTCQIKPRYHFAGLKNLFYERPPYRNCSSAEDRRIGNTHCTRFIGLAKVGNAEKNKWIYAANLTPLNELKSHELSQTTTDETECPYASAMKEKSKESSVQYFYDFNAPDDVPKKRRRNASEGEKNKKNFDDPETCWFCLASNAVEKHLVISIGEEIYIALAKGGLTPYHVMIVPVKHYRAQTDLPKNAADELKRYKSALKKFFKSKNLVPVFFERNYKTSHLQMHVIPVPEKFASTLKELFLTVAEELDLKLSELPNKGHLKDFAQAGAPYFYLELPSKEKLFCPCQKNFPIQFGRDVLASRAVLNLPGRVNWRDCVLDKEEEIETTQNFRTEFESFDDVSS